VAARGGVEPPTYRFSDVDPIVQVVSCVAPMLVNALQTVAAATI
jgi:hypothetical protein